MVRLHETTGRALCRLGFVVGCLLPTAWVLAYVVAIRTPWYRQWHEARWSDLLGVTVRLGDVRHPRPGMTVYGNCRAFDAETATEVGRVNRVELLSTSAGREVRIGAAELQLDGLDDARIRVSHALRQTPTGTERLVLRAQEVVCHQQGASQRLLGAQLDCQATAVRTTVEGEFRPDDALPNQIVRFGLQRDRSQPPAVWRVHWDGRAAVPLALVHTWWPAGSQLGLRARVVGRLEAVERTSGWEGRFVGQILGVDLDRLVSNQFPHRLSGSAEWTIQHAAFAAGRVMQARGTVHAGPGTISRSLIASGTEWLGWLSFAEEPPTKVSLVKYDRLAAAFMLDRDQLVLRGLCREQGDGVLLAGYRAPLLLEPRRAVTAAALVQTLAPAGSTAAWTHPASRALAGWLPPPTNQDLRMARVPGRVRPNDARPMAVIPSSAAAGDAGGTARSLESSDGSEANGPSGDRSRTGASAAVPSRGAPGGRRFGTPLR